MRDTSFLARFDLQVNHPLATESPLGIGGNADFFAKVTDPTQATKLLCAAAENGLKTRVYSGGTNTVFSDYGARGLVMRLALGGMDVLRGVATIGAGVSVSDAAHWLVKEGYSGLEYLVGLPGTIGGALWSNAHVGEHTISDVLESVTIWSRGRVMTVSRADMQFGPYDSRLTTSGEVVLSATFNVKREAMNVLNSRLLGATQAKLRRQPGRTRSVMVFRDAEGHQASGVLAQVDLAGERIGGARVSEKDPNYILIGPDATAQNVYDLARRMKDRVAVKLTVPLRENIVWQGEW